MANITAIASRWCQHLQQARRQVTENNALNLCTKLCPKPVTWQCSSETGFYCSIFRSLYWPASNLAQSCGVRFTWQIVFIELFKAPHSKCNEITISGPCLTYYCDVVWVPTNVSHLKGLERLHSHFLSFDSTSSVFNFTLAEHRQFHTATQVYRILNKLSPPYLHPTFRYAVCHRSHRT